MEKKVRGEITKISNLFDVYKKRLKAPQGTVIDAFIEIVTDLISVTLTKKQCSYSVFNKILYLNVSGPAKMEILIHKKEILTHLKGRLGEKSAPKNIL